MTNKEIELMNEINAFEIGVYEDFAENEENRFWFEKDDILGNAWFDENGECYKVKITAEF